MVQLETNEGRPLTQDTTDRDRKFNLAIPDDVDAVRVVAAASGEVLGTIQQLVNGSPVRDTTAQDELNCALFNGEVTRSGNRLFFTRSPRRNFTRWPAITSWNIAGQTTFAHKMVDNPGYQQVNVVGTYEYDFVRNTVQGEIDQQTFQAALAAARRRHRSCISSRVIISRRRSMPASTF